MTKYYCFVLVVCYRSGTEGTEPVKHRTKNPDSKPYGRPRRHAHDAVGCSVKLGYDLIQWIDQRYPTRQDGIADIIAQHIRNAQAEAERIWNPLEQILEAGRITADLQILRTEDLQQTDTVNSTSTSHEQE
jgi:hypothetical protein